MNCNGNVKFLTENSEAGNFFFVLNTKLSLLGKQETS